MTNGNKILADIASKKKQVQDLAIKYINLSKNGEIMACKDDKITILNYQIESLTRFYNNNFDESGNNIEPIYSCPSTTLIRRYINPNYVPTTDSGITIDVIDGNE